MTAKEYLMQIRDLNTDIKNIDDELKAIKEEQATIRSAWPDGQPHGTGTTDPTGTAAAKLADQLAEMTERKNELRNELWSKRESIIASIDLIERKEHRRLLYMRYVTCSRWEEIAVDMHYTYRHIVRMHGSALQDMDAVIRKNVTSCHRMSH